MKSIEVKEGQVVNRGTDVGNVGNLGNTNGGCHLHMSIRKYISGSWYSVRPVICGQRVADEATYRGCK